GRCYEGPSATRWRSFRTSAEAQAAVLRSLEGRGTVRVQAPVDGVVVVAQSSGRVLDVNRAQRAPIADKCVGQTPMGCVWNVWLALASASSVRGLITQRSSVQIRPPRPASTRG